MKRLLFWLVVAIICQSCVDHKMQEQPEIDYGAIENELLADPALQDKKDLISSILELYRKEIPRQYSQRISLGISGSDLVYLDNLDDIQIDSIRHHMDGTTRLRIGKVNDAQIVDGAYLVSNVRNLLAIADKYPWNQSIPDSIILNFLLPYKVIHEYPDSWWNFLKPYFQDSLLMWSSPSYSGFDVTDSRMIHRFTTVATRKLRQFWKYNDQALTFTKYPSMNEVLLLREGGCYLGGMINVMILRTCGIPATIDEVPFWGSMNGSHAADVYWSTVDNKMVGGNGQEFYIPEIGRRAAKVIRHTFRYTGVYTQKIAPNLKQADFQIPQLKGDFWYDVTKEYTTVDNLKFFVDSKIRKRSDIGYIYVMNYGQWVPLFYGRVQDDSIGFTDMGREVLYRAGFHLRGSDRFITRPFILDKEGRIRYSEPDYDRQEVLQTYKINHGENSDVVAGQSYTLQYLDVEGHWQDHATLKCEQDSLLSFPNVPSNAFYMLKSPSDTRNLARIFLIGEDGEQVWY